MCLRKTVAYEKFHKTISNNIPFNKFERSCTFSCFCWITDMVICNKKKTVVHKILHKNFSGFFLPEPIFSQLFRAIGPKSSKSRVRYVGFCELLSYQYRLVKILNENCSLWNSFKNPFKGFLPGLSFSQVFLFKDPKSRTETTKCIERKL